MQTEKQVMNGEQAYGIPSRSKCLKILREAVGNPLRLQNMTGDGAGTLAVIHGGKQIARVTAAHVDGLKNLHYAALVAVFHAQGYAVQRRKHTLELVPLDARANHAFVPRETGEGCAHVDLVEDGPSRQVVARCVLAHANHTQEVKPEPLPVEVAKVEVKTGFFAWVKRTIGIS